MYLKDPIELVMMRLIPWLLPASMLLFVYSSPHWTIVSEARITLYMLIAAGAALTAMSLVWEIKFSGVYSWSMTAKFISLPTLVAVCIAAAAIAAFGILVLNFNFFTWLFGPEAKAFALYVSTVPSAFMIVGLGFVVVGTYKWVQKRYF